jgi:hypothetical protein
MVDLVITGTNVVAQAGANVSSGFAGEVLTAGQAITQDATTFLWFKADNNSPTATLRRAQGIALNGAAINQAVGILTKGDVAIGATMVAGTSYYLGDTPGGICPPADVTSGEYVCLIGIARTTAILAVDIQFPNVVV